MLFSSKRIFLYAASFLSVQLFGYDDLDIRISDLEKQMLEVSTETRAGTYGAKFASNYRSDTNFYMSIFGEALFWQAKVGGREYAYSASNMTTSKPHIPFSGEISEISFDWDWGFRVGLGVILPEEMWGLNLIYTRFKTSDNKGNEKDWPEGFMGLTGYLTPALKATSDYEISYNSIDAEFGRSYYISANLNFLPFVGLKNSWIDQTQLSHYLINLRQNDLISFDSNLKDKCDYWGIGPKIGVYANWFMASGIHFTFKTSGSLLYGNYDVTDNYIAEEVREADDQNITNSSSVFLKGNTSLLSPYVDMSIGLGYQGYVYRDKLQLRVSLSYEVEYYWRQNEMLKANGSLKNTYTNLPDSISKVGFQRTSEDLTFYGVTFLLGLSF